jgi:hypothetical protein
MIAIILAMAFLSEKTYTKEQVFTALHAVESGSKLNPPDGDNGKAIGPFQIWKSYFQDAKEHGKLKLNYEDCRKLEHAKRVVGAYMARYEAANWADTMTLGQVEAIARAHNGGPSWRKKRNKTDGYWAKVKKELGVK